MMAALRACGLRRIRVRGISFYMIAARSGIVRLLLSPSELLNMHAGYQWLGKNPRRLCVTGSLAAAAT